MPALFSLNPKLPAMSLFCLAASFCIEITQYINNVLFGDVLQKFFYAGIETLYFKLCRISNWGIDLDNSDFEELGSDSDGHNAIINYQETFHSLGKFIAFDKCHSISFPGVM